MACMDEIVEFIESVKSVDLVELVYLVEIAEPVKMVGGYCCMFKKLKLW